MTLIDSSCMARVVTCARNAEKLEELVSTCKSKGWDVQGVVADVGTPEGRTKLFEQVATVFDGQLGTFRDSS